jgi:hypothetical protein
MELPEPVVRALGDNLLQRDHLYREDKHALIDMCYEQSLDVPTLESVRITKDLTLMDVLMITRAFRFLGTIRRMRLQDFSDEADDEYWNSLIGSITEESAVELASALGFSEAKTRSYLSLFSWRAEDTGKQFVDLQYRPIIRFDGVMAVMHSLIYRSNIMRNAMFAANRHIGEEERNMPLSAILGDAFATKGCSHDSDVEFHCSLGGSDIDFATVVNDTLYIFECKNTILPCTAFEQKTFFDHL